MVLDHLTHVPCRVLGGLAMIKRGPMDWPTPHMCLAGSGVLALAALKLGASKAVGTDVDPLAVSKHNRLLFAID